MFCGLCFALSVFQGSWKFFMEMKDASWVELEAGNLSLLLSGRPAESQKLPCLKVMYVFLTYQTGLVESYFLYSNIIKRWIDRFSLPPLSPNF